MSIEAMKTALEALDCLIYNNPYAGRFADALIGLRTAIQQAEARQPAKPEPFGYFRPEPFGWTDCAPDDEGAMPLYEHPAPSVPADVVRDAWRYRFIRDADVSDDLIPDIALYAMESLDEYIDAAMLAAKDSK